MTSLSRVRKRPGPGQRIRFWPIDRAQLRSFGLRDVEIVRLEVEALAYCRPGLYEDATRAARDELRALALACRRAKEAVEIARDAIGAILHGVELSVRGRYTAEDERKRVLIEARKLFSQAEFDLILELDPEGAPAADSNALETGRLALDQVLEVTDRAIRSFSPKQKRRQAPPEPILIIWDALQRSQRDRPEGEQVAFQIGPNTRFREIVGICYEAAGHPSGYDPVRALNTAKALLVTTPPTPPEAT